MSGIMNMGLFSLTSALLLLCGCVASFPGTAEPPAGTYRISTDTTYLLAHRSFLLHVPPNYRSDTPLPLVVVLHGAFNSAGQTELETGFSTLADSERFLVAYPEGIGLFGLFKHWNAGHCCGKAMDDQVDDVGFIARTITIIRQRMAVDPARIYMAGMSNGGMLTYRFAAERTGDLGAAAVVSGAIGSTTNNNQGWQLQQPGKALPMIIFHGLADENIPVDSGTTPRDAGKYAFLPVNDAVSFWVANNGCGATPVAKITNNDSINHRAWEHCHNGSSVELVLLAGWGHQWPAPWFTDRLKAENPLKGFNATKQIWEFFSRFRRSGP